MSIPGFISRWREVHVAHAGRGGRNQDVAVSAIPHLKSDTAIVACASDGRDNEPVAGVIADGQLSRELCQKYSLNSDHAIAMNDSYPLLEKLEDHLYTKAGTANIADFIVAIRAKIASDI